MSDFDPIYMQREIDNLRRELSGLRRQLGNAPGRVAGGGGGGGLASKWIFVAADYAALDALTTVPEGGIGFTKDLGNFYGFDGAEWWVLFSFIGDVAPSLIGEHNGDFWHQGSTGRMHYRTGDVWKALPWEEDGLLYYETGSGPLLVSHLE